MATTSFTAVKKILDDVVAARQAQQGQVADLSVHGQGFGWETRDQLVLARAFDLPLIDPSLAGNGNGAQTNLVVALRQGVSGFPRMPPGGPFLDPEGPEIKTLIQWIDEGMPS
jgi:hypothetical protein